MLRGELERAWQARYERWATVYDEEYRIAGWSAKGLSRRLALVLNLVAKAALRPSSLVLDLGAGPGTYTRAINQSGHICLGMDYSRKVIETARKRGTKEIYVQGEAYHLPFRDGIFDAVVCIGVLQSLRQTEIALKEMRRVLAPGGHLFLDGLNSLFWVHRFRCWRESVKGERRRMSYYDPYHVRGEAERLGFSDARIYWLTVPEFFHRWMKGSTKSGSPLARWLVGYAFLLHARKTSLRAEMC